MSMLIWQLLDVVFAPAPLVVETLTARQGRLWIRTAPGWAVLSSIKLASSLLNDEFLRHDPARRHLNVKAL